MLKSICEVVILLLLAGCIYLVRARHDETFKAMFLKSWRWPRITLTGIILVLIAAFVFVLWPQQPLAAPIGVGVMPASSPAGTAPAIGSAPVTAGTIPAATSPFPGRIGSYDGFYSAFVKEGSADRKGQLIFAKAEITASFVTEKGIWESFALRPDGSVYCTNERIGIWHMPDPKDLRAYDATSNDLVILLTLTDSRAFRFITSRSQASK